MSATPRPYPLLARLRYAYFEAGEELPVVENAWWEGRWDGGRALGAVVEAMAHPRQPHRLRVHLRLGPDDRPREMELTLLRPDGEGQASYRFEAETVHAGGVWNGETFRATTAMPPGYTVAPYCIAADGLHFRTRAGTALGGIQSYYMVNPKQNEDPLQGRHVSFNKTLFGEDTLEMNGRSCPVKRFRAAYEGEPAPPADYWVTGDGYVLRMESRRRTGERTEAVCIRLEGG